MIDRGVVSLCFAFLLLGGIPSWTVGEENVGDLSSVRVPLQSLEDLAAQGDEEALARVRTLLDEGEVALLDPRTGRWAGLMPAEPLLPGMGQGNDLRWVDLGESGEPTRQRLEELAWQALRQYLVEHQEALRIDPKELVEPARVTVHREGGLIQIYGLRRVGGVLVEGSHLHAVIGEGNLILLGTLGWGDVTASTQPSIRASEVVSRIEASVFPWELVGWGEPELRWVPRESADDTSLALDFRLAWVLEAWLRQGSGPWEVWLDAHGGDVLQFHDLRQYADRRVVGGVYPRSNDGLEPGGLEVSLGFPFLTVDVEDDILLTDAGGQLPACGMGAASSGLVGPFFAVFDGCGPIGESSEAEVLDFGMGPGTDCATPPGAFPGNTHASRTAFWELNRIAEMARGYLPDNPWLSSQVLVLVNATLNEAAFWDGNTLIFGQSSEGFANPGELVGILDHEWGHALDDHDATGTRSNPGEGIADVYASLRQGASCIGRGLLQGKPCGDDGDACLKCDGLRDLDWALYESEQPRDLLWADLHCGAFGIAPCDGFDHCEGRLVGEAIWDLGHRDLQARSGLSDDTAAELTRLLTFQAAGAVGDWFQCTPPYGGCGADGGYLNYLAADDDDGDLGNGTPHMEAIFEAFDRHQIACDLPTVQSSPSSAPTQVPELSVVPGDRSVFLEWSEVPGAAHYIVLRQEIGGGAGKTRVGQVSSTSFVVTGLTNGQTYGFQVIPQGLSGSSLGQASELVPGKPRGPKMRVSRGRVTSLVGDGDPCLDEGETFSIVLEVESPENVPFDGIVEVSQLPQNTLVDSHPLIIPDPTTSSYMTLVTLQLTLSNLSATKVLQFELCYQPASPMGNFCSTEVFEDPTVSVGLAECDVEFKVRERASFDRGEDGWEVVRGTFERTSEGGLGPSDFFLASSAFLDDQCDEVASPPVILTPTSTLALSNRFDIEGADGPWQDRANVGVRTLDEERLVVEPSGGRTYNASGPGPVSSHACNMDEAGWAGSEGAWAESLWDTAALDAASLAGQFVRLSVRHATDLAGALEGFQFDEVVLTDVWVAVPDTFVPMAEIFADGFESGDTSAWSSTTP